MRPVYPAAARAAGLEGTVVLECTIGVAGRVTAVNVVSGPPALAAAAVEAVRQWTYEPTVIDGGHLVMITKPDATAELIDNFARQPAARFAKQEG